MFIKIPISFELFELCFNRDAIKVDFGTSAQIGEGVPSKFQILLITDLGHYWRKWGFQRVMSQTLRFFSVFLRISSLKFQPPKPLILTCLQTEQSTIETTHINFLIQRGAYSRICVS